MLIGEVAQQSGISARMLRHYDRVGLVTPSHRTSGGYREYTDEDLQRLFHVEGLRSLGLSLIEIRDVLDDLTFDPAAMVEQLIAGTRSRLEQDRELLRRLGWVKASDPAAWSDVLRTIGLLRGLDADDPRARQRLALSLALDGHDAAALAEAVLDEPEVNVAGTLDWALAQAGDSGVDALTEALHSPQAARRHRAVAALAKIGSPAATTALAAAFEHDDPVVRTSALLARGSLGEADAIPGLISLVVEGRRDVDASDVLGALASEHGCDEEVATALAGALARESGAPRPRLAAALADVPGPLAVSTLTDLTADSDPAVAHTATYLLSRR
ncbi:MerR family transcriptional regulator [Pseudactinotalea sp.]|uniref:MerR family transcriptional regulator n=1 Tax=Pseudactinotalea sp. TaxID=1926260 RepID=UPI003B3BB107